MCEFHSPAAASCRCRRCAARRSECWSVAADSNDTLAGKDDRRVGHERAGLGIEQRDVGNRDRGAASLRKRLRDLRPSCATRASCASNSCGSTTLQPFGITAPHTLPDIKSWPTSSSQTCTGEKSRPVASYIVTRREARSVTHGKRLNGSDVAGAARPEVERARRARATPRERGSRSPPACRPCSRRSVAPGTVASRSRRSSSRTPVPLRADKRLVDRAFQVVVADGLQVRDEARAIEADRAAHLGPAATVGELEAHVERPVGTRDRRLRSFDDPEETKSYSTAVP